MEFWKILYLIWASISFSDKKVLPAFLFHYTFILTPRFAPPILYLMKPFFTNVLILDCEKVINILGRIWIYMNGRRRARKFWSETEWRARPYSIIFISWDWYCLITLLIIWSKNGQNNQKFLHLLLSTYVTREIWEIYISFIWFFFLKKVFWFRFWNW